MWCVLGDGINIVNVLKHVILNLASLVAQMVKNLPAMQETWVPSLGQEGPLEKEMATHSGILAWEIPWTEGPDSHKELDMTEQLPHTYTHTI